MKPTLEEFMKSNARWFETYKSFRYELSWHGCSSEHQPEGIWCYYLILMEEQFLPEDWQKLRMEKQDKQFFGKGRFHRIWNYDNFPDLESHGGWSFGEMKIYLGRDGRECELAKIGCDYNHSFDADGGYWEKKDDVERDARRSIDLLVQMFPNHNLTCAYSGMMDRKENFYTARNGSTIHKSHRKEFSETNWAGWMPADA